MRYNFIDEDCADDSLVLCTTESFIVRDYHMAIFDSPEMWATRFHALTWDQEHEESAEPREERATLPNITE